MSGELFQASATETLLIKRGEPLLLLVAFLAFGAVLFFSRKGLREELSGISKRTWLVLLGITVAFLAFRMLFVPITSRVYFDEDLYQNMARNILTSGESCMCNAGLPEDGTGTPVCIDCILNKPPAAHPFLLAISQLFLGPGWASRAAYAAAISTLSTLAAFLCAYFLFGKSEKSGILAAILLSTIPVFAEWSNTLSAEPALLMLSLVSAAFLALYAQSARARPSFLALFFLSLSILAQVKTEAALFIPLFASSAVLLAGAKRTLKLPSFWLLLGASIILCSASFLHAYVASKGSDWGASGGDKFSKEAFLANLPINAGFLLFGYPGIAHPFLLSVLAAGGLLSLLFLRQGKNALFLLAWFLAFFLLYTSFYAGSVRYGTDVRYSLAYYPALVLLAAATGKVLSKRGTLLLAAFCIIYFSQFVPQVATPAGSISEAMQARQYYEVASSRAFPQNCTVISHVSAIYLNREIPSVQPWYLENPDLFEKVKNTTKCAIFDSGYWCTVPPYKDSECARIQSREDARLLEENGPFAYYSIG